jgi:hypothetical protein
MEQKNLIIITLIVLIVLVMSFLLFQFAPYLSPSSKISCSPLAYHNEKATNILFFSDEKTTKEFSGSLFSVSPFKENRDSFNIYSTDEPINCSLINNMAVYCYSRTLLAKASSCPSDYVVVIKEEDKNIRSSAYMNVMSLNKNSAPTVLAHEFGHTFSKLADEYVPAQLPRSHENCVSDCKDFSNTTGCFKGCSDSTYYRSIDSGIMKTLSAKTYGSFNENLIKKDIVPISNSITGNAISENVDCNTQFYYLLEGSYKSGDLAIKDKAVQKGCAGGNGKGRFDYSLLSSDGKKIVGGSFDAETLYLDFQNDNVLSGGTEVKSDSFFLRVPYKTEEQSLNIKYDNKELNVTLKNEGDRPCQA